MRYTKYYTVKEWKRADKRINGTDVTWQEKILEKYEVILTDHKTRNEKLSGIFSPKNLNRNIDSFQDGITRFSKALDKLDGSKIKLFSGIDQKEYDGLFGKSKRDYSGLMGKSNKQVRNKPIMGFWSEPKKKRTKKTRHYEVVERTALGEGQRLGIVKASSPKSAAKKLGEETSLPKNIRVYPVKLTKTKKSVW